MNILKIIELTSRQFHMKNHQINYQEDVTESVLRWTAVYFKS